MKDDKKMEKKKGEGKKKAEPKKKGAGKRKLAKIPGQKAKK